MLRILGQRNDGYHFLQTYFQLLNWGDYMEFAPSSSNNINIHGNFNALKQQDNLIFKAAELLIPYKKTKQGVDITVEKNIPQGSGLGGGSSNAGTTLTSLNSLWKCDLSQQQLQEMAIKLGADVPIFVLNKSAMATGIGEKLVPFKMSRYYYVLLFPKTSISTIDVFSDKMLERNQSAIAMDDLNNNSNWTNACLPVVLKNFPEVRDMYKIASEYSPIYMSGTGSTLFSCFKNQVDAKQFIKQCPNHWNLELCQSKLNEQK